MLSPFFFFLRFSKHPPGASPQTETASPSKCRQWKTGFCLNKPKLITTKFSMCSPLGTSSLRNALNLIPTAYGSTFTVSSPSHTCNYPDCHLKLTSQHTPAALTVFFGDLPKWPIHKIRPRTSAEMHRVYSLAGFNRWPLKTFQHSFIYQLCTSTHHLVQQISQRPGCNTDTPLIYLIRCDKKMTENDLISSSRNQEKGEKDKCISTMCHAAWLLLLWTMFQAPFSPHYPFSSRKAELKHILQIKKHCENTVDSLCCSVTADQCRSLVANSKGSFTADLQAN